MDRTIQMNVQVINLDRDAEKWQTIQKDFGGVYKLMRFSAVDGSTITNKPWYMTNAMSGCLESHRRLWTQCVQQNKAMIVFEDDCFPITKQKDLSDKLRTLPSDYDVAVFGYLFDDRNWQMQITRPLLQRRRVQHINKDWRVPGYFAGSHAYIVSVRGAEKLLARKETFHVDAFISRCNDLRLYALNDCMFGQRQPGCIQVANTTLEWVLAETVFGVYNKPIRVWHIVTVIMLLCVFRKKAKQS